MEAASLVLYFSHIPLGRANVQGGGFWGVGRVGGIFCEGFSPFPQRTRESLHISTVHRAALCQDRPWAHHHLLLGPGA